MYIRGLALPQDWCGATAGAEDHESRASVTIFSDMSHLPDAPGDGVRFVYLPAEAGALADKTFSVPEAAPEYHVTPEIWWKRIVALFHSPYELTLTLDIDSLPTSGAALAGAFADLRDANVFTAQAPMPYGGSFGNKLHPAPPGLTPTETAAWESFPERNLGLVGWNFNSESARAVAVDFARAFVRELETGAAVHGDQTAFREALFQHRVSVRERLCETTECCRWTGGATCSWLHSHETWEELVKPPVHLQSQTWTA
jgi:hypothetical protein